MLHLKHQLNLCLWSISSVFCLLPMQCKPVGVRAGGAAMNNFAAASTEPFAIDTGQRPLGFVCVCGGGGGGGWGVGYGGVGGWEGTTEE